jgi:hypothetical protein
MEIELIAIIRTSELSSEQMEAVRDKTYPADHEGDLWLTHEFQLRDADAPLADEMVKGGAKRALIMDDVNTDAELEDLQAVVAP